ncbi:MAG: HAD family hydrolase [Candidatus Helarchaeota archaeon]
MDALLRSVVKNLAGKDLNDDEISRFWRSGRNFDKVLASWGIENIKKFWKIFDNEDYNERLKMIEEKTCYLYPDALEIITKLNKYERIKKGIISNTPASIAKMELEKFKLDLENFDILLFLGTQQQKIAKPNPRSIEIALNKMKTEKKHTYIIGDTILDIMAGKNAGIKTIYVLREHNKNHQLSLKPDYTIQDLNEICEILKNE